ncbi:Flap-structured DNA-binding and RNA-binding protein [Savitreella phatthalungensis]
MTLTHFTAAQVYDKWLDDLQKYENTLEDMAGASLDSSFKEELGAIEQWFRVLSDAERTAALYSLLQHTTHVQIRFFIMVLQQMARQDPLAAMLSPAPFGRESSLPADFSQSRASIVGNNFTTALSNSKQGQLQSGTISQMFPDAALALANQRAELQHRKRQLTMASAASPLSAAQTPEITLSTATGNEGLRSPWTPSFRRLNETPARPRSAEPSKPENQNHGSSFASGSTLAPANSGGLPFSPFGEYAGGSGNWASMTNTPASSMFPGAAVLGRAQDNMSGTSLAQRLAAVNLNNRVVLDNDVRKFRRDSKSGNGTPGRPGEQLGSSASNGTPVSSLWSSQTQQQQQQQQSQLQHHNHQYHSPYQQQTRYVSSPSALQDARQPRGHTNTSHVSAGAGAGDIGSVNGSVSGSGSKAAAAGGNEDPTDPVLLADIPSWLRHLRLHKYKPNFDKIEGGWRAMIELDDAALQNIGVSALGARRKLLKAFEQVKEAQARGSLEGLTN